MDVLNSAPHDAKERWIRQLRAALGVLPYAALALAMLLTLVASDTGWPSVPVTGGIAVVAGGWVFCMFTLRPGLVDRPVAAGIAYAGLLALALTLSLRSPWFGLFAFCGYLYLEYLPHGLIAVGVGGTALASAIAQTGGYPALRDGSGGAFLILVTLFVVNASIAGIFVYEALQREAQNQQRTRALAQVTEANTRLEAALAENAGLHAQLLAWAREAGVTHERQRMAREIHDTIAQGLIGVITQLEAAQRAADLPDRWRRHLGEATKLARAGLAEARRSVQALRPEPLADARLPDALREVTDRWSTGNDVAGTVQITGTARPLHPEVETALLRTVQEALANVAKHAAAGRVGVTLSYMEDVITLDVRDDGTGFDPTARPDPTAGAADDPVAGGFGLIAMRQRLDLLSGTLAVESEPGGGTAISATVPAIPASGTTTDEVPRVGEAA